MTRTCLLALAACALLAGCHRTPATRSGTYESQGYSIQYEFPADAAGVATGSSESSTGVGAVTQELKVEVTGRYKLHIKNGALSLNDAARGTVKPGDKIRVTADGKLYVNDAPRE